jgi:hypothetical protein
MVFKISTLAASLIRYIGKRIGVPRKKVARQANDVSASDSDAIVKAIGLTSLATKPSPVTVVFLHYHPSEYFAPGYVQLIKSACTCGYRVIVVSSTRPSRAKRQLGDYEFTYIQRKNKGYDFGALRDARHALACHGLLTDSRYVIINSSLINIASKGFGHDPVLDKLAEPESEIDLLGVTSSYEQRIYHIQSYYYSFSAQLFCSSDIDQYFQRYWLGLSSPQQHMTPRDYAIKNGELGLTSYILKRGYSASSLFEHFHLPSPEAYATIESLWLRIQGFLPTNLSQDPLLQSSAGPGPSLPTSFITEWRSKPGLQTNMSQACWALLLAHQFLFIKRELLENYQPHNHCHARSAASMLMSVLRALDVEIPSWSDMHVLNRLVFASKP